MAYHSLSDSGMTDEERRQEAWVIINIMREEPGCFGKLTRNEMEFVEKMARGFGVSTSQLFYLRDLKTNYCE